MAWRFTFNCCFVLQLGADLHFVLSGSAGEVLNADFALDLRELRMAERIFSSGGGPRTSPSSGRRP